MGCVFGLRRWAVALESDVVGCVRRKFVSVKKLSVRKRGSFVDKKPSVSGFSGCAPLSSSFDVCPFDRLPCEYGKEFISSCDDVLSLVSGFDCVEGGSCFRAVKVPK